MNTDANLRQRLERVQRLIAELSANLAKAEAIRDGIIRQLCDTQGAHDRRPVAVR